MMPDLRKVQRLIGAKVDGVWGDESSRLLDEALAKKFPGSTQIPDDYWPMLAQIESGNRPYVRAATSSASGLYQFTKATWLGLGGAWGQTPGLAFGGLMPTRDEQLSKAKIFTQKNADALVKAGVPVTKASLYAAHFLGVGGAISILRANPTTPLDKVASSLQIVANQSVLGGGKTVADFRAWLDKKTSASA